MVSLDPGARLAQLIMGTAKHCYIQNVEALGLMVSEKKNYLVLRLRGVVNLDPGAWLAQFITGTTKHC